MIIFRLNSLEKNLSASTVSALGAVSFRIGGRRDRNARIVADLTELLDPDVFLHEIRKRYLDNTIPGKSSLQ